MYNNFFDIYEELSKLCESKEDQEKFINKFGKDRFDRFNKLKSKLANVQDAAGKSISTDITYHIKHTSEKDLDTLLDRAENKQYIVGETAEYDVEGQKIPKPANTKKLIKSTANYNIYRVTDYSDAIDLARQKINQNEDALGYWCIAGRYQLPNDSDVKVSQAKQFFYEYLTQPYDAYYFCMPKDSASNKLVICKLTDSDSDYEAFDAEDNRFPDEMSIPDECKLFTDAETGFTAENYVGEADDEEAGLDETVYTNIDYYLVLPVKDPVARWIKSLDKFIQDFTVDFTATVTSDDILDEIVSSYGTVEMSLSSDYFDRCPLILTLNWELADPTEPSRIDITATIMYPPDIKDTPVYDKTIGHVDIEQLDDILDLMFHVIQNINIVNQTINTIKKYAEAAGSELDIVPMLDDIDSDTEQSNKLQTLAAYDIPVENSDDDYFAIAINIGFDPIKNMLDKPNKAVAFSGCYSSWESEEEGSIDIYDTTFENTPAARLQDLVKNQISTTMQEISKFNPNDY